MLAVSQQISSVAHIVNVLSRDLFELKKQVASNAITGVGDATSVSNQLVQNNGPSHDEMQRAISTSVSDCHARITEVKRVVDAVKVDLSKEIVLLETSLSRKIEGNVNKMLNDKIAVALDSYKNSIKDMILTELQTANGTSDATIDSPPSQQEQDDFEINVTLASADGPTTSPAMTTPANGTTGRRGGGRKASASSKAVAASAGKDA